MLTEVVARYQKYNPMTGAFDMDRTQSEYARLLDVDPATISLVFSGQREPGVKVLRALVRAFPAAAAEITAALATPVVEREAVSA